MGKILRNIVAPVIIPAVMFVTGCKVEKPVKEDYLNRTYASFYIRGIVRPSFEDLDGDQKIDVVFDSDGGIRKVRYIAKGYEQYCKGSELAFAKTMTSEMRTAVSKIAQGFHEFEYEIAKEEYEQYIERKREKEAKKEAKKKK